MNNYNPAGLDNQLKLKQAYYFLSFDVCLHDLGPRWQLQYAAIITALKKNTHTPALRYCPLQDIWSLNWDVAHQKQLCEQWEK